MVQWQWELFNRKEYDKNKLSLFCKGVDVLGK